MLLHEPHGLRGRAFPRKTAAKILGLALVCLGLRGTWANPSPAPAGTADGPTARHCLLSGFPSLEILGQKADLFVVADVERVETASVGEIVYTDAWVRVRETWHGPATETLLRVRQPGGRHADRVTDLGPRPDFQAGQAWALGLVRAPHGWWTTFGMTQGAFRIEGNRAIRDLTPYTFVEAVPATVRDGRESLPLDALKSGLALQGRKPGSLAPGVGVPSPPPSLGNSGRAAPKESPRPDPQGGPFPWAGLALFLIAGGTLAFFVRRRRGGGAVVLLIVAGTGVTAWGYSQIAYTLASGTGCHWTPETPPAGYFQNGKLMYRFYVDPPYNVPAGPFQQAFVNSAQTWEDSPDATIGLVRGSDVTGNPLGSGFFIIFTDTAGVTYFGGNMGSILASASVGMVSLTRELAGASITFNGSYPWRADKSSSFDVEEIALHEMGHCLGIDHTVHTQSVMSYVKTWDGQDWDSVHSRRLSEDDHLAVSAIYPPAGYLEGRGKIRGTITLGGAPVYKAQIGLYDSRGLLVTTTHSLSGEFDVRGVRPGTYTLRAFPTFAYGDVYGLYMKDSYLSGVGPPTPFLTEATHDLSVTVNAGSTTIANMTVAPGAPAMRATMTGLYNGTTYITDYSVMRVKRGTTASTTIRGVNFPATLADLAELSITGGGVTLSNPTISGLHVFFDFSVAPDADLGLRTLFIRNAQYPGERYQIQGWIEVYEEGSLTATSGPSNPGPRQISSTGKKAMLQAALTAGSEEPVRLRRWTVTHSGSGNPGAIGSVTIHHDLNGNGAIDAGESAIGSGSFVGSQAAIDSAFTIPAGATQQVLVAYDFTGAGLHGETHAATLEALDATGLGSTNTFTVPGIPRTGNPQTFDLTAPAAAAVSDGLGADIDTQASLSLIEANWGAFADLESGIAKYEWAIGTLPGAQNVMAFADVGLSTSASSPPLSLSPGQAYHVTVRATNGVGGRAAASSDGVTTNGTAGNLFLQDPGPAGLVAVEGESEHANVAAGGHTWSPVFPAGYSGTGARQAMPNNGTTVNAGYAAASPRLDYRVYFTRTGTYRVWVRGIGPTGSDDSCHVGLDGMELATSDRMSSFGTAWTWSNATMDGPVATINVTTAGVHTVNVWMREDGFIFDKLLLTLDTAYIPTGTGPAESPKGGPPAGGNVLFVVGNATLNTGDAAVKSRLEGLGFAVTVVTAPASTSGNASGKVLVVVSSTCASGDVNTKFRTSAVPVLCWEPFVLDDFGMTGPTANVNYGSLASQTAVSIVNAAHPMAAGRSGAVTVTSSAQTFTWGAALPAAQLVATLSGDASQAVIFGYEAGAAMSGLAAPARRVGFFLNDVTASALTANGSALLDAAVTWATGGTPPPPPPPPPVLPVVTVSATDAAAAEAGGNPGVFTVSRTGATSAALAVRVVLSGTATEGADYATVGTQVTILAGASSQTVTIVPTNDANLEGDETVVLTIASSLPYDLGDSVSATAVIADDDAPPVLGPFSQDPSSDNIVVIEAENFDANTPRGGFNWVVTTSVPGYSGAGALQAIPNSGTTLDSGYAAASPRLDYRVNFHRAGPHFVWIRGYAAGGNDHTCHAGLDGYESPTGDRIATTTFGQFVWFRSTLDGVDATVDVLSTGVRTLNIWMRSDGFVLDKIVLTPNPTFTPTGYGPTQSYRGMPPPGPSPTVSLLAPDPDAAEEGSSPGYFTIYRNGSTDRALDVHFEILGTATAGSDYAATPSSPIKIPLGEGSVSVTITPLDDSEVEGNETVILRIYSGDGYGIFFPSDRTVTIADNDLAPPPPTPPTVTLTVGDATASEAGTQTGTFTLTRTGNVSAPLTVQLSLGGTAAAGSDYVQPALPVVMGAGISSVPLTVLPIDDSAVEGDETVIYSILADAAYTVGSPSQGTVTLADNDAAPPPPGALFVVGNTTLNPSDLAVKTRLEGRGFVVATVSAPASTAGNATGKSVVVISSTCVSGDVNVKFRDVAVPVLNWETSVLDDLGMAGPTYGTHYGATDAQTAVSIVDASHPMAAGLSGRVTTTSAARRYIWGVPNGNAKVVATLDGDPGKAVIFGYEAGVAMPGLTAPARRVAVFLENDAAEVLTANGWALFDAAVSWAAPGAGGGTPFLAMAAPPAGSISIDGRGDFPTLQAAIDAASPGETILLAALKYSIPGGVTLKGGVSLRGAGPHLSILDGQGASTVLRLSGTPSDGRSVIEQVTVSGGSTGIDTGAADALLRNLQVVGLSGSGILSRQGGLLEGHCLTVADNGGDGLSLNDSRDHVRNVISAGNRGAGVNAVPGVRVSYSTTLGNGAGIDTHATGIEFVDPASLDYRVFRGSVSIDAGDPSDAFNGEPAPNGGRVDQGAHGNTVYAAVDAPTSGTKSAVPTGAPAPGADRSTKGGGACGAIGLEFILLVGVGRLFRRRGRPPKRAQAGGL